MNTHSQDETAASVEPVVAQPAHPTRRRILLAGGGVGLIALLGGAAYMAGRLLNQPQQAGDMNGPEMVIAQGGGAKAGQAVTFSKAARPNIKPASEMPQTQADVSGLFLRREDNSLFIGTGRISVSMAVGEGSKADMHAENDGPTVEVVVTRQTHIFKDITPLTMEDVESGKEIQQVLEQVHSLDALVDMLGNVDAVQVWGARNGDRYVATTILYHPPMMIGAPASKAP